MNLAATQDTAWLWIYAKLLAANVTGGRIYREKAPASPTYPLTVVGIVPFGAERGNGKIHMMDQVIARIRTISKDNPPSSTLADRALIYAALDGQAGTVGSTGGMVLACIMSNGLPPTPEQDETTTYYHPGFEFELIVQ